MDCPYNLARIHTLSCRIGDILEISTDTEFTPWDRAWKQIAKAASRYKVVGLIGSAWEMEILSGSGPQEIRLLNSEIPKYTISITKATIGCCTHQLIVCRQLSPVFLMRFRLSHSPWP